MSILYIPLLFGLSTWMLYSLKYFAPPSLELKFPSSLEEIHDITRNLNALKDEHMGYIYTLYCAAYLYKQAFSIPGSVFMNLLAGALFGLMRGFLLACTLTATGASFCFMMSKYFGKDFIMHHFKDKLGFLQEKINSHKENLFYYLLFLRIMPLSPNWFLNMASPILDIPFYYFVPSVFFGLMPYIFVCVQTGNTLADIKSIEDVITMKIFFTLFIIAAIVLLPAFLKKKTHTN